MKIFNWVHRKFHHAAALKEEFARDVKANELESQTLLEQISMGTVLDVWKDGSILTIGTFGFDPSEVPFYDPTFSYETETEPETETETEEDEDEAADSDENAGEGEDNESELKPLVFTTLKQSLDVSPNNNNNNNATEIEMISDDNMCDNLDDQKKKGERTTLADLFLADHSHGQIKKLGSVEKFIPKKKTQPAAEADLTPKKQAETKNGMSLAKKIIPQVGDKPRPIKKLNQMMKRMMKRKIHPELDQRKVDSEVPELEANNESAYLLPIPEAVVSA